MSRKVRKVAECDVNTRDKCGDTALHWAACEGRCEEVRRLVGRGAEVDIRNSDGLTAVMLAVRGDHGDILRLKLLSILMSAI